MESLIQKVKINEFQPVTSEMDALHQSVINWNLEFHISIWNSFKAIFDYVKYWTGYNYDF